MIRILLSCIAILTTIFYCVWEKNKANTIMNENCIEVYLYKEFITPEHIIPLKESDYYEENKNGELKDLLDENYLNRLAFDTIKNKIVVKHGGFKNKMNLIESTPFIKNEEIKFFKEMKSSDNKLILSKDITTNMYDSQNWNNHLKQFVILVNKKPVLNGYLFYFISSSICDDTNILVYARNELPLSNFKDKKITNINLKKDYPELYQAFKNTNRLIE